ncbi:MAG TPA: non-canonical purine NTP pyrophosphatase, partial [Anaerolineaceae bacterium]|nr:non-canonical purine NTP pyrophosphatase [Anaerolineaceae bacterium]
IYSSHGICPGQIIEDFRGENGFGFDPIFLLADRNQTMAELSEKQKNELSHRARAIQAFDALRNWANRY